MANNPNAADNLQPWKPGQSGNPGGKTSEQKQREMRNAEMATRMRERMLEAEIKRMEADPAYVPELDANLRAFIKDAEDRGLGAPKQVTEVDATVRTPGRIRLVGPDSA